MLLDLDTIKGITVGAEDVTVNENGVIRFFKCTDKINKAWAALSDVLGSRALTTTGIRLDFHTNSRTVTFNTETGAYFDLLIDGVITKHSSTAESKSLTYTLPEGDTRVTFVFPSHGVGSLVSVEVDDGAYVRRHDFDTKLLFIGDSITQGHKSDYDCISYAYHTSFFFNADSMIQGIGGAVFHDTTFDPEMKYDPDTVIIAYGTNDFGRYQTLDELRHHVKSFLDALKGRYGDKKIICLSPIWRGDDAAPKKMGYFSQCREVIIDEIASHGFIHIDGYTLAPHDPWFYSDAYLHPNATGFGIYALNLIKQLQKHI